MADRRWLTAGSNGEGLGLAKLEELIQRAEALVAQQRGGVVVARAATQQRDKLRRALLSKLLLYLRAVGAVAAKQNPELAVQFQLPPANASHQALLTVVRGMLEKATAQKELFVSRGMSPMLLDALAGALGEFEKTLEASREGRRNHVAVCLGRSRPRSSRRRAVARRRRRRDGGSVRCTKAGERHAPRLSLA